jgi:hypothetical protein
MVLGEGTVSYERGTPVSQLVLSGRAVNVIPRRARPGIMHMAGLQGFLALEGTPPPLDHPRTLGTGLMYGPRGLRFHVSEVPL